jgi:hypothetical protein
MTKTIVADAVQSVFALSAEQAEQVAMAAEMAVDSEFDFGKAADSVFSILKAVRDSGGLTFARWEAVRVPFVRAATTRARDNKSAHPEEAATATWGRIVKRNAEMYGLTKPKSENADSERKRAERETKRAEDLKRAEGKSSAELKSEVRALYGEASDESIAKAKALEKSLKLVESAEADALKAQMKPLVDAAKAKHSAILELLKSDTKRMGDYVVLLAKTHDIWVEQLKA